MRINLPRMLAIGAIGVALAGIATTPAQAAPGPDGTAQVIALGGSDTIVDVMGALATQYNADSVANPDHDNVVNIPTLPNPGAPAFNVPAQGPCPSRNYVNKSDANGTTTFPAPNGSTDGKNALQGLAPFPSDNLTSQCIDVARSSSPRGGSDPGTFQYNGFALDAVSWAAFDGGAAPASHSLTLAQIRGIYNCTFTNWNQVGGQNAAIIRYEPQAGSGTRAFFEGTVLGFAPPPTCAGGGAGGVIKSMEENHGNTVAAADRPAAIAPYSVAQFVAQGNGVVADTRGGAFIGAQGGQNPVSGTGPFTPNPSVVFEGSSFIGLRTVFNVVDTRIASAGQADRFVGDNTDGGASGYLCSGQTAVTDTLKQFGFSPFTDDGTGNFCRPG